MLSNLIKLKSNKIWILIIIMNNFNVHIVKQNVKKLKFNYLIRCNITVQIEKS